VVQRLLVVGESFSLFLFASDPISQRFTFLLESFLVHAKLNVPVLAVHIPLTSNNAVAQILGVSMVPQLRVYSKGVEARRVCGTLGYDGLEQFLR